MSDAQSFARTLAERLARLGDPDAGDAKWMLAELTTLSSALHDDAEPPESYAVVSRLLCISARCRAHLGDLQHIVDRATAHVLPVHL